MGRRIAVDEREPLELLLDRALPDTRWKIAGQVARKAAPHLVPEDSSEQVGVGLELDYFGDLFRAMNTAASSLPLVRSVGSGAIVLALRDITYHPQEGNSFLLEHIYDNLADVGLTIPAMKERVERASEEKRYVSDPVLFGSPLHHTPTQGTLTLALRDRRIRGTLHIDSFAYAGFPEITPTFLPKAVFKPFVHRVQYAGNLRPKVAGQSGLPEDLAGISIYTRDHHGSDWSLHCGTYAPAQDPKPSA